MEIKFAKQCYKIYTGGKSNDYKKYQLTISHGCIRWKEKMQSILYLCPIGNVLMKTWGCKGIIGILGKVYRVVIDRNYNIIKKGIV